MGNPTSAYIAPVPRGATEQNKSLGNSLSDREDSTAALIAFAKPFRERFGSTVKLYRSQAICEVREGEWSSREW